jgi:rhodanese-related sulfurtransferase
MDMYLFDDVLDLREPSDAEKEKIRNAIIGLALNEAENIYPDERIRECIKNGKELSLEEDLNLDRCNVETRDNKIIRIVFWG